MELIANKIYTKKQVTDWTAWVVCLSAGLFFLYEFFQMTLFNVINDSLRDSFSLNAVQVSWLSSAFLWADLLFLIPAGILLDIYSVRLIVLWMMALSIIGTVGFALTNSFWIAFWFHFLAGVGNAFCFLACIMLVVRWFVPQKQAFVIGCIVTMAFLGGMLAHAPLAYLSQHFGWRGAILIDGLVGVIILIWMYFTIKDAPKEIKQQGSNLSLSQFLVAFTIPANWLGGIYTACLNLPIMVLCALWGGEYLKIVHHLSDIESSHIAGLILLGSCFGCPIIGLISDKLGRRKPVMICGALITLILLIPLFINIALSTFVLSIIFFMLGFVTSAQIITYPVLAESNSPSTTGAATSLASIIIMGGAALAQILFGKLLFAGNFAHAMWLFPITTIVGLGASMLLKETFCRKYE